MAIHVVLENLKGETQIEDILQQTVKLKPLGSKYRVTSLIFIRDVIE